MDSVRTARAALPITDQHWPLAPVARLTAVAIIEASVAVVMTDGLLRNVLVVCGAGLGVAAAAKLARHLRGTR
ncbi:MAG: hypothetical protein ACREMX_04785 [Gemmatimonadales bacterium]